MSRLRGFALLSAIFILVVLAALGAFVLNVTTSQQIGSALDVQGVRAYQTARAGIEWGLFRQLQAGSCAPISSFTPAGTSFSGLVVSVTCNRTHVAPDLYRIEATACNQPLTGWTATSVACPNTTDPGAFYVERRLTVTF